MDMDMEIGSLRESVSTAPAALWSSYVLLLLLSLLLLIFRRLSSERHQTNNNSNELCFMRAGLARPDLHGMDSHEVKVLKFLELGASSSAVLGIYGMHGVGKSTLLHLLRTSYASSSSFDYVLLVRAGPGFTVAKLRDIFLRNIGLLGPQSVSDTPTVAAKVISRFLGNKTFLLLLDDVRESIDLQAAGLPMPLIGHRQKVVFTTTNPAICAEMGCAGNTIQMQPLGEDDAWNLFRYLVTDEIVDYDTEINELAKKMVAICRGFPSALRIIGATMSIRSYDVKRWRVAYDLLTKTQGLDDDEGCPCLQLFEDEI